MKIHRFEAVWLGASLLLIVGFVATIVYGTVGAGVAMVEDDGGTIEADEVGAEDSPFADPGVEAAADGDGYVAYVVARQFQFQPGTSDPLTVPADANVTFRVTSPDVVHGFSIVGTNVNTMVIPGQVAEMTVRFDEPGEYGLVCHEYCGAGHHTMEGTVRVVPGDEYEGASSAGDLEASGDAEASAAGADAGGDADGSATAGVSA